MDGRVREINRLIKRYDGALFCKRVGREGMIAVYRGELRDPVSHQLVFALSDDWSMKGTPREWGLEVILSRLQAIDIWKGSGETVFDRLDKQFRLADASKERDVRNNIESFLYDFRRQFARATDSINTGSMDKTDSRARHCA